MARKLVSYTLVWLTMLSAYTPIAIAGDENYGDLDFRRLSQKEEHQFFNRLAVLAFEEAFLVHCGQPDNFAAKAREAIRACVTKEALDRAEKYFVEGLNAWSKVYQQSKQSCAPIKVVSRTSLGVHIRTTTGETGVSDLRGAVVADVMPFVPAAASGIKAGDVIISVNEKAVSDYKELLAELSPLSPSSVAKVGVQRNGKALTLNVKLTAFTYGPDGQMASNGAQLLADGRQDLAKVLTEVTKLCQYCKYSMFSLFCR